MIPVDFFSLFIDVNYLPTGRNPGGQIRHGNLLKIKKPRPSHSANFRRRGGDQQEFWHSRASECDGEQSRPQPAGIECGRHVATVTGIYVLVEVIISTPGTLVRWPACPERRRRAKRTCSPWRKPGVDCEVGHGFSRDQGAKRRSKLRGRQNFFCAPPQSGCAQAFGRVEVICLPTSPRAHARGYAICCPLRGRYIGWCTASGRRGGSRSMPCDAGFVFPPLAARRVGYLAIPQ